MMRESGMPNRFKFLWHRGQNLMIHDALQS